nr:MAG TPA: minor tail protein [Caudoviricetes sp.]
MADNEVQIDSLSVAIEHSASTASKDLSSLASSLKKLQTSVSALNMWDAVRQFDALGAAAGSLTYFSNALDTLQGKKISSSIGRQLKEIGDAANSLSTLDTAALDKVKALGESLKPLGELGRAQLTSFINQLAKLPALSASLDTVDMERFAATVERLTAAMAPLATEMDKIARGFSAFPQRIQTFIKNNEASTKSVKKAEPTWQKFFETISKGSKKSSSGLTNFAKQLFSIATIKKVWLKATDSLESANEYIEALNLFYVSMGSYAEKAQDYANLVGDSYGVDPAEFMKMQATFMDVSKSFGTASGTAYTMSKALTQLTYDISSLYNLKVDESLNKVRSALVGEIEPIRALGKDLSVANLKLLATELGITANVDAMNQSEKAMLRTISLLRQSNSAMGDMARTLEQPANQFRILKAQLTLLERAIGDLFLPLVQKTLPYMIAFVKVGQRIVSAFAALAGFELPKFDYADSVIKGNEGVADSADDAAKSMKKLYQLSFDELNILGSQNSSSSGIGMSAADLAKLEAELNRLAKIEDDMFSKNFGEATDKIAAQIEKWLTNGKGVEEWAKNVWEYFSGISEGASEIAAALLKWKVPQKIWDFFKTAVFKVTGIDLDFGGTALGTTSGKADLWKVLGVGIGTLLGIKAISLFSRVNGFGGSIPNLLLSIAALSIAAETIGGSPSVTGGQTLLGAAKTGITALLGGAAISLFTLGPKGFKAGGLPLTLGLAGLTMSATGIFELGNDTGADDLAGAIKLGIGALLTTAAASLTGVKVATGLGAGAATAGTVGLFAGALSIIIGATIGAVVFPDECRKAFEAVSEALGHSIKSVTDSLKDTIDKAVDLGSFDFKAQFGIDENTFKVISTFGDPKLAAKLNEVTAAAKQNVQSTSSELDNLNRQFYTSSTIANQSSQSIVNNTTKTIKNGINDVANSDVYKPLYDMMDKVGDELNQKGTSAGKNVAKGFANGTSEGSQDAAKAMQELSRMTMQLFTDDLGIHSPSTVFKEYGQYVDLGFAEGVTLGLPNVTDAFGNVWTSIRVDFSTFANSMLASARTFVNQLNQTLSSVSFNGGNAAKSLIGKTPRMVPAFATGGFPEDGMFYANSGELVGRFANGRTAVANNAQIIEGIENAVYRAMTAAQRGSGRWGKIELVLDKQVVGRAFGDAIDSEKRRSGANTKITFTNGGRGNG